MAKYNCKIKIGLNALECCNRWISVSEIAYLSDVTPRQVLPALMQIPDVQLEFKKSDNCRYMLLTADESEQRRIYLFLMGMRYNIPDIERYLKYILPCSSWVTVKDLSFESGIKVSDLMRILDLMDCVVLRNGADNIISIRQKDTLHHV